MSLPNHLNETFSPEEIQFLVENEPIRIFPRITTRQMVRANRQYDEFDSNTAKQDMKWKLITMDDTSLNNMVAMKSTQVTLWVALILKQQAKCSIIAPAWLTVKELDRKIQYEQTHLDRFSEMPWNWLVLAQLLFNKAADDFHDPVHELRSRVQDLREIRQSKVLKGLQYLNESHLQLDNLSVLEINELRPFIIGVMDKLRDMHAAAHSGSANEDQDIDNYGDDRYVEAGV
ncbi:hypothetical protein TBLA_0D05290 [Henningerozyma blattae CBS 6284]|uniref:DNA replication complex GINS protein PSF2 n=1 Tax=Henningerozyma blattae (strain ATCC 34711 / CBS 6284 / DSM 70876 / NBRC 10599 / NRRL Y-10934 / UCD 77-7) TaxID=1071380 RepID=I2H3S1_HENB6|nr:hypothetical protein TBLA_0D05290 [Tetrapisispora blattae CBS 6284]CCH61023.1 hypothetical protein TBLA_0D05290 [Tetrapisispora blattae CBS 6284]